MSTANRNAKVLSRPAKAKFAMTGVVTGVATGMVLGFVVEMAGHPSSIYMQVGGLIGFVTGGLVELVRYWWCRRGYHKWQAEGSRDATARR